MIVSAFAGGVRVSPDSTGLRANQYTEPLFIVQSGVEIRARVLLNVCVPHSDRSSAHRTKGDMRVERGGHSPPRTICARSPSREWEEVLYLDDWLPDE